MPEFSVNILGLHWSHSSQCKDKAPQPTSLQPTFSQGRKLPLSALRGLNHGEEERGVSPSLSTDRRKHERKTDRKCVFQQFQAGCVMSERRYLAGSSPNVSPTTKTLSVRTCHHKFTTSHTQQTGTWIFMSFTKIVPMFANLTENLGEKSHLDLKFKWKWTMNLLLLNQILGLSGFCGRL